jgi:hypothetical protein
MLSQCAICLVDLVDVRDVAEIWLAEFYKI